jgi:hypothetical protein
VKINLPAVEPAMPVHPYTGLTAIGWSKRGPIWPVLGGAEPDDTGDGDDPDDVEPEGDDDTDGGSTGSDAGADQLGDAGKQALDRMKGKWQTARDRAKDAETRLAEAERLRAAAEAKLAAAATRPADEPKDQPKDTKVTDQSSAEPKNQIDPQKVRDEATAAARAEVLRDRALDKVEAKAAKLFADPEDARALLAPVVDKLIDNGQIDVDEIESQLADLLKKKPHLAAQSGRRFGGGADGGARNGKTQPSQVTEQELARMTPEQIVKARQEGRLAELLGATP